MANVVIDYRSFLLYDVLSVYRWNGIDTNKDRDQTSSILGNDGIIAFSEKVKAALESGAFPAPSGKAVDDFESKSTLQQTLWGTAAGGALRRSLSDETSKGYYGHEDYSEYGEYGYEYDGGDDDIEPTASPTPSPTTTSPTPAPTPSPTTASPTPAPTPAPTPGPTEAPEVANLIGVATAAGAIRNARVFMDFSGFRRSAPVQQPGHHIKTSMGGIFAVNVTKGQNGDLTVFPGGEDSFTGLVVPFALKMPLATQLLEDPKGRHVVVSPISTLAFYTRMYVVASIDNLLDRVRIALDLKGLPAGLNKELAYYDPLTQAGAAAFKNDTEELKIAVGNAVANFNLMSVVSSTASLYSGACLVDKDVAGEWAFQAMAEAGTRHKKKLELSNEVFVRDLMTSDTLAAFCSGALASGSGSRKLLATDFATIKAQLVEDAASVAKATVELNAHLDEAIKSAPPSREYLETTFELVAIHSIVSQTSLADQTELLAKGQVKNEQFENFYTGEALTDKLDETEVPESVQKIIELSVATMLNETLPVPVEDDGNRFTAAEIVGMVVGPLLFIAIIVTGAVLVLLFINHRKQRVQAFGSEQVDTEEGLISTAEKDGSVHDSQAPESPTSKADESAYYTMPAPAPLPAKKDMLAPSAKPSAETGLDLVAEAKKVQEEKARQEFEAILKVQQEQIMSNKLAKEASGSTPADIPPPPPAISIPAPNQEELSLASKPEGLPDFPEYPKEPVGTAEPESAQPPAPPAASPVELEKNPLESPKSPGADEDKPLLPGQQGDDNEASEDATNQETETTSS